MSDEMKIEVHIFDLPVEIISYIMKFLKHKEQKIFYETCRYGIQLRNEIKYDKIVFINIHNREDFKSIPYFYKPKSISIHIHKIYDIKEGDIPDFVQAVSLYSDEKKQIPLSYMNDQNEKKFIFHKNIKFIYFSIHSSNNPIEKDELPENLKKLYFYNFNYFYNTKTSQKLISLSSIPPNLKFLSIKNVENIKDVITPTIKSLSIELLHELTKGCIPSHIKELDLHNYVFPWKSGLIPDTIEKFSLYYKNESMIHPGDLPESTKNFCLYNKYNYSLQNVLPRKLRFLSLSNEFNQSLGIVDGISIIPDTLAILSLGVNFTPKTTPLYIPPSVRTLYYECKEVIDHMDFIPPNVKHLYYHVNHIKPHLLPKTITHLYFKDIKLKTIYDIPESVVYLKFEYPFNRKIRGIMIPKNVKKICFDISFSQPLTSLPINVKKIILNRKYGYKNTIPSHIKVTYK